MTITEQRLQSKILRLIRCEELLSKINVPNEITALAERHNENSFVSFSIDHHVRLSCARAAAQALSCLTMLVELTEDLNVSTTEKEVLRPDIVCHNAEPETLVIFELKKSGQTGRQALTELLAYEQELKNTLPFLSNYDTVFVLISTEWTTLMDHSAASAVAWSGKTLLCLEAAVSKAKLSLNARLPQAWRITGSRYFPPDSLPTVTICLYDYSTFEKGDSGAPTFDGRLFTAIDLIAREGDRIGGHGFLLVWKDYHPFSQTAYNITACGVAPFAFYKAMRERGNVAVGDGHLIEALDQLITEIDPNGHSQSMFKAIEAGMPLLREFSSPHYEGFHTWADDQEILRGRSIPIWCDFWGLPGVYAREFVASEGVRKHKSQWLGRSDWREPRIGVTILNSLIKPTAFGDGHVRCSDCFKFGLALGRDILLRQALGSASEKGKDRIRPQLLWGFYELSGLLEEIRLLANAATNIEPLEEPLTINGDPESSDVSFADPLIKWFANSFLQSSPIHCKFLEVGLNATALFDRPAQALFRDDDLKEACVRLRPEMLETFEWILSELAYTEKEGALLGGWKEAKYALFRVLRFNPRLSSAKAKLRLREKDPEEMIDAWPLLLDLADSRIPPVFHRHAPIVASDIDWGWLKQGVMEMRGRGVAFPAVHLEANGTIATGPVGQEEMSIMGDVSDPDQGVLFCDHSNGLLVILKTTWSALKSGKHFPVRAHNALPNDAET